MSDPRDIVERRLAGHDAAHGHDTAGLPWEGREVTVNPYAGDTGAADPRLADALQGRARDRELLEALAAARLLVAVVAMPTAGTDGTATGLHGDSHSDMATVVLAGPDGERALPAFTSVADLARWDAAARPVPVSALQAAQAAIEERCSVLVLDPGSPHRRAVRGSQLWALAQERHWVHAADDPVVRGALDAVVMGEPQITAITSAPGPDGSLALSMSLPTGLTAHDVQRLTQVLAAALAEDEVRIRIDGVALSVRHDEDRPVPSPDAHAP